MDKKVECPDVPTKRNVVDIGDIYNGNEGPELLNYIVNYRKARENALEEADSKDSIFELLKNYVAQNPYTSRRFNKKKTKIQMLFEENHYPHQRPMHGPEHPVNIRDSKHPWNMNPGRLYVPRHVGDRLKEIKFAEQIMQQK